MSTELRGSAGWAHSEQNLALGESWLPQLVHVRGKSAAHSSQNFAPDRFSCWHRGHFILKLGLASASESLRLGCMLFNITSAEAVGSEITMVGIDLAKSVLSMHGVVVRTGSVEAIRFERKTAR